MKRSTRLAVAAATAALGLTSAGLLQAAENTRTTRHHRTNDTSEASTSTTISDRALGQLEKASKLNGKEILGADNQKVGKLVDTVVDLESGHILYAIVGSGGVGPVGEKKYMVAPGTFTDFSGDKLHVNFDKAKLTSAPEFTKNMDKDTELGKADPIYRTHQFFSQNIWWQGGANAPAASTGQFNNVHKSSDLVGMKIRSVSDQEMGKIDNVMLNLPAGRVAYVILNPDNSLGLGNNFYALPPNTLTFQADKKDFSADISKEKLASAPHFDKNNWAELSNPSWASQA